MTARILIAGIGNIFLGDDAFGVEVVRRLASRTWPEGVQAIDFGIRGLDLTYALLDGWDAAILVDAAPRGEPPGTLYVIEPAAEDAAPAEAPLETHCMDPVRVLRMVASLGGRVARLLVVGCEPTPLEGHDIESGLSPPVAAAVPEAARMVESLVEQLLDRPCDLAAKQVAQNIFQ